MFFKKKKPAEQAPEPSSDFMRAVQANAVDRRQVLRVRLPAIGAIGNLPTISFQEKAQQIIDIGMGGLGILNWTCANPVPGNKYIFDFSWYQGKMKFPQEAVFLRNREKFFFFQFSSVNPKYTIEFSHVFKAAIKGSQVRVCKEAEIPLGQGIQELWMSTTGDFLKFTTFAEVSFNGLRFAWTSGQLKVGQKAVDGNWSFAAAATELQRVDVLLFLSNLKNPSARVQQLVDSLSASYLKVAA